MLFSFFFYNLNDSEADEFSLLIKLLSETTFLTPCIGVCGVLIHWKYSIDILFPLTRLSLSSSFVSSLVHLEN